MTFVERGIHLAHDVEGWGDKCVMQGNGELARDVMHAGAGILHWLRKVRHSLGGVTERQRAHAEPLPQELARIVEFTVGAALRYLLQSSA